MSDDAQRKLERHALRNVRDLVDKLDAGDADDKGTQRRLVIALLVGVAIVVAAVVYFGVANRSPAGTRAVDIPPPANAVKPKPGQVMPDAPRASQ